MTSGVHTTPHHTRKQTLFSRLKNPDIWIIGGLVIVLVILHFTVDIVGGSALLPSGIPVGLLLVPVSYATVRFGLRGAVWTSLIATLLWLPDLLLPDGRGHPGNDIIELGIVLGMAIFIGLLIDRERHQHLLTTSAEERYRALVDGAPLPIFLVDTTEHIVTANPAALSIFSLECRTGTLEEALGSTLQTLALTPQVQLPTKDGMRTYRIIISRVPDTPEDVTMTSTELFFTDITEHLEREALMAELLTAQEEERRTIAMDLHDDPLQLLIAAHRLLTIPDNDSAMDSSQLRLRCNSAEQHILTVISALRSTITGLRPAGLESLGLAPALSELVRTFSNEQGPTGSFEVEGTPHKSSYLEDLHTYRIVQEAISNIVRHAHASHFSVHLAYHATYWQVTITDNGTGLPHPLPLAGTHHGISGMHERARLIGGELHITSTGHGTTVACTVPAPAQVNEYSHTELISGSSSA